MMYPIKIVVSGAVGAGKTTLIQTLSETEVISTDVRPSEDIGKAQTTVAFDFGTVQLGEDLLLLFGTPGQERFDFMWDVLCQGAMGLLLLVSGTRPGDFRHSRHILDFVQTRYHLPYLLGVTHQDHPDAWAAEDVAAYFDTPPERVIGLDATSPEDCRRAVSDLLMVLSGDIASEVDAPDFLQIDSLHSGARWPHATAPHDQTPDGTAPELGRPNSAPAPTASTTPSFPYTLSSTTPPEAL